MKKVALVAVSLLLSLSIVAVAQTQNTNNSNGNSNKANKAAPKRGPIFRANADQIKQAQAILKQRSFYAGEPTGRLDASTRDGLKKYQTAAGLKVTGTLNKITLEKMSIALTEKQKTM